MPCLRNFRERTTTKLNIRVKPSPSLHLLLSPIRLCLTTTMNWLQTILKWVRSLYGEKSHESKRPAWKAARAISTENDLNHVFPLTWEGPGAAPLVSFWKAIPQRYEGTSEFLLLCGQARRSTLGEDFLKLRVGTADLRVANDRELSRSFGDTHRISVISVGTIPYYFEGRPYRESVILFDRPLNLINSFRPYPSYDAGARLLCFHLASAMRGDFPERIDWESLVPRLKAELID